MYAIGARRDRLAPVVVNKYPRLVLLAQGNRPLNFGAQVGLLRVFNPQLHGFYPALQQPLYPVAAVDHWVDAQLALAGGKRRRLCRQLTTHLRVVAQLRRPAHVSDRTGATAKLHRQAQALANIGLG